VDTSTKVGSKLLRVKPKSQPVAAELPRERAPLEQMMRVPVNWTTSVIWLGTGRISQHFRAGSRTAATVSDNLLHQVQQLGNLSSRMQELYEQSLLELANK